MLSSTGNPNRSTLAKRVLLLMTARTYRARPFLEAASRLGIEVVKGIDMPRQLSDYWKYPLGMDYSNTEESVKAIVKFAAEAPLGAIVSVDDSGSLVAALASEALGLPHNTPAAAAAASNKYEMRQLLAESGVPAPKAQLFHFDESDGHSVLSVIANQVQYPCVVKPLTLSGSRGVIRANDPQEFTFAAERLRRLLGKLDPSTQRKPFLVEEYVSGVELALEGLLDDGQLRVLALFDKPDPLEGPYFEETIYVTPSRLPAESQTAIFDCVAGASAALGLRQGPVHAEIRVNDEGPWIIELAGRSIGGLCSQTLRFGTETSLEELILRQAFGMSIDSLERENLAGGVMMIPIPESGLLRNIHGCQAAESVPLVESVQITAKVNYTLTPLPEGDSYLGFIFARGDSPAKVETALREAHGKLSFDISPHLELLPV